MEKLVKGETVLTLSQRKGYKMACIEGAEVEKFSKGKSGEINYTQVMGKSLLRDFCEEVGLKVSKNNVTKDVIGVKFNYAYRSDELNGILEENKIVERRLKKIKSAKKKIIKLEDELSRAKKKSSINNKIKLIEEQKEILTKYNEEELECKYATTNKMISDNYKKKQELRDKLYNEGFTLPTYKKVKGERVQSGTITYKYFFRNAGKAKKGEDLFINEKLLKKVKKWQLMGIKIKDGEEIDYVGIESYKSLTSSVVEGYIKIEPHEILIVKDLDSYSDLQEVIKVQRNKETGLSEAIHTKDRCKNTLWDGMGLLQGGEGFRSLRHHFTKLCAFCSDFQSYFRDYYKDEYETATIKDMFGRDVLVKDIKLITTDNAIKWIKFLGKTEEAFNQWCEWISKNDYNFGVCKRDHASKYGELQRMSYQMVNTLPLSREELSKIFSYTRDYVINLNENYEFLLKTLDRKKNVMNNYEMLIDLVNHNKDFVNSYYFRDQQKAYVNSFKSDLNIGKVLNKGDNLTICGNPFLLLEYCVGLMDNNIEDGVIKNYTDKSLPNKNSCYSQIFEHGKTLGSFRSPHNAPHNVMVFINDYDINIMKKYFYNIGRNAIAVNLINNDVQDRGNGLDEDGDFAYTTDDETTVEACEKCQVYPTIVNCFEKNTNKYTNTMSNLAKIDNTLQENQKAIGTSSNVAQLLLSEAWDEINKNGENERTRELFDNVAILSVLAQCAIDSAKRQFIIGKDENGLNSEIARIRKKISCGKKPTFWQYTSVAYNYDEIEKKLKQKDKEEWKQKTQTERKLEIKQERENMINMLENFECPMNWILDEVSKIPFKNRVKKVADGEFLVEKSIIKDSSFRRKVDRQCEMIEKTTKDFNDATKFLISNNSIQNEDIQITYVTIYEEYIEKITSKKLYVESIYKILEKTLSTSKTNKIDSHMKSKLLTGLYKISKENFLKCFKIA